MNALEALCKEIDIPEEVAKAVLAYDQQIKYECIKDAMDKLFDREIWDEGRMELQAFLGEDTDGFKMLTCMLRSSLKTREYYKEHNISEEIFRDTMKCFCRFVKEHKAGYGRYAFDREWWTARQLAGVLFRIGELEYEMRDEEGRHFIELHIPSDTILTREKTGESLRMAKAFFEEKFPAYRSADVECHSWLLSPTLKEVLSPGSHILEFQELFQIQITGQKDTEYMVWVYKRSDWRLEELPEDTSLQRNLKKYLLAGGAVEDARGKLLTWQQHF